MRLSGAVGVRVFLALALSLATAACGENADAGGGPAVDAPPLHSFDVYAIGSADGNILEADLYGISLNPLRAHRVTEGKRISWISADSDTVVVAAGDQQIDKLGYIQEDGQIGPIPGLGRPAAYSPVIQPDGTIRYEDDGPGDDVITRYMSYDPDTSRTTVLFRTTRDMNLVGTSPEGRFLEVIHNDAGPDAVALVSKSGDRRVFTVGKRIEGPIPGKDLIAIGSLGSPDPNAPATATIILDPTNGKTRSVDGWAPLTWTPDGTKLLVVRAGETRLPDAELAVLDPAEANNPQILGTIPGLTFFQADWVAR